MRTLLHFAALLILFAGSAFAAEGPPNIIYILADDLGYGDLGCYGQAKISTPNLDRLGREGIQFTQHYAGCTVCAPSRCALMTGLDTGHCTVRGNVDVLIRPGEITLGTVLREAGYHTACIGKWGIGHPPPPGDPQRCGFDYFFGYLSMWHAHNAYPEFLWRDNEKAALRNVVRHPATHYKAGQAELTGYAKQRVDFASDLFTRESEQLVARTDRPFFLFLCYTVPHANSEAQQLGAPHGMEVPDLGRYERENWPQAEKAKAAMISRMDTDIGSLLEAVKKQKLDENTLIIFSSDNGPHKEGGVNPEFMASSGPLRGGKRDLYEGGIRVPMIARWPGHIRAGRVSDHVSAFWDILPTFAELAGVPVPPKIDGISLLPELLGRPQRAHDYLYWEFHEGASKQALRMGKWKAVRLAPSKPIELYDLTSDLGEQHDVAAQRPDIVAKAEDILRHARTDEQTWPLLNKTDTMPF